MLAVGLALVVAACGDAATPDEDVGAAEPVEEAAGGEPEDAALDLVLGTTDLGEVLVDGDGMTLYLFTEDPPGESVCVEDCLAAWPPLLVDDEPQAGTGIDASLVGTVEREDGAVQVTYDDAPLYTWAADQQPGDVSGQGVEDVWFVVAADGSPVMDTVEDASDGETEERQETRPDY